MSRTKTDNVILMSQFVHMSVRDELNYPDLFALTFSVEKADYACDCQDTKFAMTYSDYKYCI